MSPLRFPSLAAFCQGSSFPLEALAPKIAWARHASWNMIARAKLAFLLLHDRIVHMDVIEYGGQILMSQQFLQAKRIIALEQIVHGEGVSQDMWANPFARDSGALFEPLE
jgi:hypothetical protein